MTGRQIALLLLLFSGSVWGEVSPYLDIGPDDYGYIDDTVAWQEGEVVLPAYPKDEDLLVIKIQEPNSRFDYLLDSQSLSVGRDGVSRFTLLAVSKTGLRNISYEGVRCATKEYKVYAYGSGKGALKAVRKPKWQRIKPRPYYRKELYSTYLCDHEGDILRPHRPEDVISTIKK